MSNKRMMLVVVFLVAGLSVVMGCRSKETRDNAAAAKRLQKTGQVYYLKYNMHFVVNGNDQVASCANYVRPGVTDGFVPYNTPVIFAKKKNMPAIIIQNDNINIKKVVYVDYPSRHFAGLDFEQYVNYVFSQTPVSYSGLSDLDMQGIKNGEVKKGMSKEGVEIAWGYPAKTSVPSLEENVWYYWINGTTRTAVVFKDGKVDTQP